jgi:hypothetical protein
MLITIFRSADDPEPELNELESFADLRRVLGQEHLLAQPEGKKRKTPLSTPAFSPCEWGDKVDPKSGLRSRHLTNADWVHFGAIDIDGVSAARLTDLLVAFDTCHSFCYSTFSHLLKQDSEGRPNACSVRFLFELTRPIEAQREFPRFITGMQALTGNIIDAKTLDATRLFYCPVTQAANRDTAFIAYHEGQPVNVDAVLKLGEQLLAQQKHAAAKGLDPEQAVEGYKLTKEDLLSVAVTIKRKRSTKLKAIADAIEQLANGLAPYAPEGEKDSTLLKVATQIAEFFPHADPESLAPLITQSIEATNARAGNGNDSEDDAQAAVDKLIRAQAKKQQELEAQQQDAERILRTNIADAWKAHGIERDTPYSEEELDGFKTALALPSDEALDTRWVIQQASAFYVFFNGAYLPPIGKDSLLASIKRDLAPAYSAGVRMHSISEKGEPVALSKDMIMERYGSVARSTIIDLNARATSYDPISQRVTEAPCPIRRLTPTYHPVIHEWLTALGGHAADKLIQWVAFVTHLESPCVMLYLEGPPGTGKSLLMRGLARLWNDSGNPAELSRAIESFNDTVMRCALVCADEHIPKEMMEDGTKVLREFQQNRGREVNRKFLPGATMIGCTRLIVASNNKHLIQTNEMLTSDDVAAIAERILHVRCSDKAADLLKAHGTAAVKAWVDNDMIAEHALYLRDNRTTLGIAPPAGRFMILNGEHTLSEALATGSGERSSVLHWLVGYLQRPEKYNATNLYYCHIRKAPEAQPDDVGELYVNPQALIESWELYQTNTKPKQAFRLSQAIVGLSHAGRKVVRISGKPVHFYSVKVDYLISWAEDNGISNREEIINALKKATTIDGRKAVGIVKPAAAPTPSMFPEHKL